MSRTLIPSCALILVLAAAVSWGGRSAAAETAGAQSPPAQEPAETLPPGHPPMPGSQPPEEDASSLPPGHPAVTTNRQTGGLPALPPGSGTGAAAVVWDVPRGWVEEPPSSSMRRAQYRLPGLGGGEEEDGQCVVYYFGPGQGGDARANALRWANQFQQPDGRPPEKVAQIRELSVADIPVLVVETTGTYSGGMLPGARSGQSMADAMLLGAIVQGPDANWFFKATGPRATLEAHRQAFEAMIQSLHRGD